MYEVDAKIEEFDFHEEKINLQMGRILDSPHFSSSPILKRFLIFIVQEKLAGRSNCIKEYTIGVNILNKPRDFNPQANGIVRIHAGRLRQALAHYYDHQGLLDEVRIILRKGNYVPVFSQNRSYLMPSGKLNNHTENQQIFSVANRVVAAVMPFHFLNEKEGLNIFAEGLGCQLTASLKKIPELSVISYNAIRMNKENISGIKEIAEIFGAHFVFTGDIQCQKNKTRIYVEIFRAETCELAWNRLFELIVSKNNFFKLQDEIIQNIMTELKSNSIFQLKKVSEDSMMAVA
jgi:TolB-like protein